MCICAGWESVDRPLLACSVVTYIAGCVFACVQAGEGRCHQVQAACPATGPVGLWGLPICEGAASNVASIFDGQYFCQSVGKSCFLL